MIHVNNLKKTFGTRVLFQNVGFSLGRGDKVALIGRNGQGKSTLFKIIMGQEDYDEGSIDSPKQYTMGLLEQVMSFEPKSALEIACTALSNDEKDHVYKAEKVLMGLGIDETLWEKDANDLSSGFKLRLRLAMLLIESPSLLLLDEPTNYLDIVSTRWFIRFLKKYPGEVIAISHDRKFLNSFCNSSMLIHRSFIRKLDCSPDELITRVEQDEEIYEKTRANQELKEKATREFIDRFRAKASKAKQVQSRIKLLEKNDKLDKLTEIKDMNLSFIFPQINSKHLLNATKLSFGYTDQLLFKDLSFELQKKTRLGIIGKNGKGKSTLLKVLTGALQSSGTVKKHAKTLVSYFGQDSINALHNNHTIVQEIKISNPELSESQVRSICGAMLFEGDDALKEINVLSGGERARVVIGKILASPSHILFLDEPTNHLDLESIDVLISALEGYPGAVVVVSHDEEIIERCANELIIFQGNYPFYYQKGYQDFLSEYGWDEETGGKKKKKKINKKDLTRLRQEIIKEKSKVLKPLENRSQKLETKVVQIEEKTKDLESEIIKLSSSGGASDLSLITKDLGSLKKELDGHYHELEELLAEIESKESYYQEKLQELET